MSGGDGGNDGKKKCGSKSHTLITTEYLGISAIES